MFANSKKALVVVSFGTTFPESRRLDIESVENALKAAFPDRHFKRAFTAKIVIARMLKNEGLKVDDLETVLTNLQKESYQDVLIQCTHLTQGEEYAKKIMKAVHDFKGQFEKISVGRPLLSDIRDYNLVAVALATQLPALAEDEMVVFMGHGSPHMHNPAYNILEHSFVNLGIPALIGVAEEDDCPNFKDMLVQLKKTKAKKVVLVPLMLVCGDHANNDMVGDDEESWVNLLQEEGYQVSADMKGMGRNIAVQNIYVMHAMDALVN